jgi:iron-sulfur cluster assembly accessory protein
MRDERDTTVAVLIVTESAAAKALQLLEKSDSPEDCLRVRVVNGGCSGMRYELAFDGEVGDQDSTFEQHGLRVVVDTESAGFLTDSTVDFVNDLNESGFKITNPNASATCGCGESFGV